MVVRISPGSLDPIGIPGDLVPPPPFLTGESEGADAALGVKVVRARHDAIRSDRVTLQPRARADRPDDSTPPGRIARTGGPAPHGRSDAPSESQGGVTSARPSMRSRREGRSTVHRGASQARGVVTIVGLAGRWALANGRFESPCIPTPCWGFGTGYPSSPGVAPITAGCGPPTGALQCQFLCRVLAPSP